MVFVLCFVTRFFSYIRSECPSIYKYSSYPGSHRRRRETFSGGHGRARVIVMASGFGARGSEGRCAPAWREFSKVRRRRTNDCFPRELKRSVRTCTTTSNTKTTMYFLSHEWSIGNTKPNFLQSARFTKKVTAMGGAGALPSVSPRPSCSRHSRAIEHVRAITDAITDDAPHARESHR